MSGYPKPPGYNYITRHGVGLAKDFAHNKEKNTGPPVTMAQHQGYQKPQTTSKQL